MLLLLLILMGVYELGLSDGNHYELVKLIHNDFCSCDLSHMAGAKDFLECQSGCRVSFLLAGDKFEEKGHTYIDLKVKQSWAQILWAQRR